MPSNCLDCVLDTTELQNVFFFDLVMNARVFIFQAAHHDVHILMVLRVGLSLYRVLGHQLQIESVVDVYYAEHMLDSRVEVTHIIRHSRHFLLLPDDV